jgi:BASS family bile acid:Na+ symporter
MAFDSNNAIRWLTMTSLGGLLFTVGLRLTWTQLAASLRNCRLGWVLPANFILAPVLTLALARLFQVPTDIAVGMLLLAAAPFAPVVPIFARMAKADLALASALTALFPFFSAFLTPLVCKAGLKFLVGDGSLKFSASTVLLVLASTITLPLAAGVIFQHWLPKPGRRLLKPLEVISEAAGAISLAFVTIVEFPAIRATGWKPLLAMAIASELLLVIGYTLSGPAPAARRVVAFGTSNRNIALALLVALESFPGSPIVAAVVANGLLLIFLGLLHVAFWNYRSSKTNRA